MSEQSLNEFWRSERNPLVKAERERDEARADLATAKAALKQISTHNTWSADKARATLKELDNA